MTPEKQKLVMIYAYLSPESGKYVYSIDNTRFTNHSSTNWNIDTAVVPSEIETTGVANRDIEIGEEILVNYRQIDLHDRNSDEKYLNY
jgi:SET domain-containing protein